MGRQLTFSVDVREQAVFFVCNEYMFNDDIKRITDIMSEYGCRLFDPVTCIRFD